MELTNNSVFITGGSSGIGRGLAEAFHRLGNRVVVSGRRDGPLRELCAARPGMGYVLMDVADAGSVRQAAAEVVARHPDLNVVINNAGVQRTHDFAAGTPLDESAALEEVNTNLLGVARCCSAFLPHLKTRPRAVLVNVSSGLAFVPLARFPIYCATKAAVHSFCLSLRHQLRGTAVRVVELIPPYVATELDRATRGALPPHGGPPPMPLEEFITQAMEELAGGADEAAVGGAKMLRDAGTGPTGPEVFARLNG